MRKPEMLADLVQMPTSAFVETLSRCLPSTDMISIRVSRVDDVVSVKALANNCTAPEKSPGCNTTWSTKALLANFKSLRLTRSADGGSQPFFADEPTLKYIGDQGRGNCLQPKQEGWLGGDEGV